MRNTLPEGKQKDCDLHEYIARHFSMPFKWGENDCCTFVGEWIRIQTGHDYLIEHRPWRTARQAAKKLRGLNGLSFFLGEHFTSVHPNMAQDGDIAIHQGAAHLFSGRHIVSVGETGLVFTDRLVVKEAWKCRQYL